MQSQPPARVRARAHLALGIGNAFPTQAEPAQPVPPKRPAHCLWAVLIAHIYEVFLLLCPLCGGQMRIIAFITYSADICQILDHIRVEAEPPRITPARGPLLWDGVDAQDYEGVEPVPDWVEGCQAAPDFEFDKFISSAHQLVKDGNSGYANAAGQGCARHWPECFGSAFSSGLFSSQATNKAYWLHCVSRVVHKSQIAFDQKHARAMQPVIRRLPAHCRFSASP